MRNLFILGPMGGAGVRKWTSRLYGRRVLFGGRCGGKEGEDLHCSGAGYFLCFYVRSSWRREAPCHTVSHAMVPIVLLLLCNPVVLCTLYWTGTLYFALQLLPVVLVALGFLVCLIIAFSVYSVCTLEVGKDVYLELMSYRFWRTSSCRCFYGCGSLSIPNAPTHSSNQ